MIKIRMKSTRQRRELSPNHLILILFQVVARSPDLATWPTEGLQPQARRETYGPADGGVWRPSPNRQLEIRKLFPDRSLLLILLLLVLLLLLDAWP